MTAAYFDTSVFIDIFLATEGAAGIRALLRELKRDKVRIYTSIITVQEVSVLSFRAGRPFDDNHAKVNKMARIQTITREIALTAAKLEAQMIDLTPQKDQIENRRRSGIVSTWLSRWHWDAQLCIPLTKECWGGRTDFQFAACVFWSLYPKRWNCSRKRNHLILFSKRTACDGRRFRV